MGTLGDGRYHVDGPSRTNPRIAEPVSAQAAVAMVVDRLPSRCGPALVGNAEEPAAHERASGRQVEAAETPHAPIMSPSGPP
ncbi:DUF6193 family natural product biosynthesis protein [Streptomyces sp. WMMC940]|uniref:DUF6193 family natural product biosynthesis protein n=1 Tax=Streptomyces sp. WMMC940 TaxID=3015153 RepID=UPI003FCECB0E